MLISRFEALGLLPDREYVIGYRVVGRGFSYVEGVEERLYDTFSFIELEDHQFEFGFFDSYGYVIFIHHNFWLTVATRKAKRFIKRFCGGNYDQYTRRLNA